jgi:hypothetical protein
MTSLLARVLTLAVHVLGPNGGARGESLAVLTRSLGDQIKSTGSSTSRVITYCPDNTCESFSAPRSTSEDKLADFALTYLFYASNYSYLRDLVTRDGQAQAHAIVERNRGECVGDDELQLASCVLLTLARRQSIRVASVRYDEKVRSATPVELKVTLAADQLKRTQAWRSEQWRGQP